MGLIQVRLSAEVEEQLRSRTRKKGDLSKIVEKALIQYFKGEQRGES